MSCRRIIRFALITVAVVTLATPAFADGSEVSRRGACSGRIDWRLDVRREDGGRLRVRFQVDGGAEAQDWHIFLSDNGTRIFSGTRTSSSGGHVEVSVHTTDRVGPDAIKAAANNVVTGETCAGHATL